MKERRYKCVNEQKMNWKTVVSEVGVCVQEWEYLIENNECEINEVDTDGCSILEILIQQIELNPLERDNIYETMEFILSEYDIDPNLDYTYKTTPLHEAVKVQDEGVVELLLRYGAEVDTLDDVDIDGTRRTALHHACMHSNIKIIQLLFRYGANPYELDCFRKTPMDYIRIHHKENIQVILETTRMLKKRKRMD